MDEVARREEFSTDLYLADLIAVLREIDRGALDRIARLLSMAHAAGRTVFCCGNGGSAAIAAHWATDLAKITAQPGRPRLRVLSLTDSPSTITAAANDNDFSEVFAEQLRTFMSPGDLVIGISTSGRSPNVLRALEYANIHGGVSIGVTGLGNGPLRDLARETLVVRSHNVQRIEDAASVAAHIVCLLTRKQIAESVTGARSKPFSVAASVSDPVV
jgi:D-sedoheptulose 7-phosphate isomerase